MHFLVYFAVIFIYLKKGRRNSNEICFCWKCRGFYCTIFYCEQQYFITYGKFCDFFVRYTLTLGRV